MRGETADGSTWCGATSRRAFYPAKSWLITESAIASELNLPAGYDMEFGGEFAERNEAVGNLSASLGVLVVVMVATLVLSFGSFRLAGIIGVVAALSGGLGLGSLWVFGYPFGFMAIIGTMGLIGVAINDSIVVLAAIREDERARMGDPNAIRHVVLRSSRHVFATTFTTIAGFLPLIIEGGGFWPPLAITIAGGVVGATLLALVFVPSSYLLVNRVSQEAKEREWEAPEKMPTAVNGVAAELAVA